MNSLLGIANAFMQGYTFVPQYRLLFVALCYFVSFFHRTDPGRPKVLSPANLICELAALFLAVVFLYIPYKLFFLLLPAPQSLPLIWVAVFVFGFAVFRIKQEIELHRKLSQSRVYADFSRIDKSRRLILDSFWTLRDLERYFIRLEEGKTLHVYGYDKHEEDSPEIITADGKLIFDHEKKCWLLEIDWQAVERKNEGLPAEQL